jgi:ArpU family phage transcriptional regulator
MEEKQLTLFEEINEKEVRRLVAKEMKQYKALKIAIQNKKEREEKGVQPLFPATNKLDYEKELKVMQMDRALEHALDDVERSIIQQKYLANTRVKDITIYLDLGLTKDQFYSLKKQAIFQIATALGIV